MDPLTTTALDEHGGRTARPRVVFLMNYVWPARTKMFETLAKKIGDLRILCSVAVGKDRRWTLNGGTLSIDVQRTLSFSTKWRHPLGFSEDNVVCFPLDTILLLYRIAPDVVITQQLGFRSLCAMLYCCVQGHCRFVLWLQMTEHQQRGSGRLRQSLRKVLLAKADHVITNGPSCTRYITGYGYPGERLTEINTACDIDPFMAIGRQLEWNGLRRLIYVGRLVDGKGLLPFLRTLDSVLDELLDVEVEFVVVGYGPNEEQLRHWKSASGRVRLRLLGYVDTIQTPEVYQLGDVFVFPTLSDEWGSVINEAMASGLPIFGSRYSQAVEVLVRDGVHGFTFTPGSNDVTPQLKRLFSQTREDVLRFGMACRQTISRVTPKSAGAKMFRALASCLNR